MTVQDAVDDIGFSDAQPRSKPFTVIISTTFTDIRTVKAGLGADEDGGCGQINPDKYLGHMTDFNNFLEDLLEDIR